MSGKNTLKLNFYTAGLFVYSCTEIIEYLFCLVLQRISIIVLTMKTKTQTTDSSRNLKEKSSREILSLLLVLMEDKLTGLEYTILREVLVSGKPFSDISKKVNLTRLRQKQLFDQGINKLYRTLEGLKNISIKYENAMEQLNSVKIENQTIQRKIDRRSNLSPETLNLLNTSISQTALSARVKSACQYGNIKTVEGLVKLSRKRMSRMRNCGAKSLNEIELFFKENGLSWNMVD